MSASSSIPDLLSLDHGLEVLHQIGNHLEGCGLGGHGQMGVGGGGFGGVLAEIVLNQAEIDARFEQVRGVDGGQTGPVAEPPDGVQNPLDFLHRQNHRETFF